jgi:hypothetical protein
MIFNFENKSFDTEKMIDVDGGAILGTYVTRDYLHVFVVLTLPESGKVATFKRVSGHQLTLLADQLGHAALYAALKKDAG